MNTSEQHRHNCECAEWLKRIRAKRPATQQQGQAMLDEILTDIAKRRGQAAADRLRDGINQLRGA